MEQFGTIVASPNRLVQLQSGQNSSAKDIKARKHLPLVVLAETAKGRASLRLE
jgi:hypothetical protein